MTERRHEMAPSTSNLKQLLEYQSKREMLEMFDGQGQLVLIVNQFIIKLCSEDDEIIILLRSLEDSAKLCWSYSRSSKEDRKFSILFWSFIAELKVFFKVPNFKNIANPNELAAAFTDLLLEILEEILHLQPYFIHGLVKEFILTLKEELRFLITFLGDTPSQLTELETTKNILSDIEVVANEVGCFLYSFFFSKNRISIAAMNKSVSDLLGNMKLLKESIKKHCVTFANIWPSCMTPKTAVMSLSFVDSILDYIGDLVHHDDDRIVDVKDQIRTIHQNLMSLNNGIKKLEIEQHKEREEFSMQLINIAYEVEYIINSFALASYITLRLLQVTEKIKPMRMQLQELKKNEAEMLKDSEYPRQHRSMNVHIGDEYLVGLNDAENEIRHLLYGGGSHLQIISISGMPGLGKTTLAKKLYDSPMIRYHFNRMAWCVLSQTVQRRNILIEILMSTSICKRETILNLRNEDLAERIYKCFKGGRYMVVMDNVWDITAWDWIRRYFPDDHCGSRILFTSRNMGLAVEASYNIINYPLRFLKDDECWHLFRLKLFNNECCPRELEEVGKKIAINCGGLPLAVVIVASTLRNLEKRRSLWMEVAENMTSYISKQMNEYMNELELSYKYLPMHLKPCFLYLGVFEKGMEIPVKKMIMLWDAERFIGKVEDKSSEDVAEEYIMHLIDWSILLVAKTRSDGRVKSCTVRGVWHDLCVRLAEKENFMKAIKDQFNIYERHQRLCIHSHSIPAFSRPFGLHIHSLLGHLPDPSAFIFSSLRHLKVLDMSTIDLNLYNLTGSGALAFLRFLAVSTMPSSIEIFKNLEFLFVDNKAVVEIPAILLNMVKLRCAHFSGGAQFSESWRQAPHDESFQMSNIQNLSSIFIYDENDEKILRSSFHHLRILKCKSTVFWDSSEKRYRSPALNHLNQLESLDISFQPCYESDDSSSELISLPSNLRKLTLRYFDLSWDRMKIIENLPNLEILKLRDHTFAFEGNEWVLNEVGLLRLKYLELDAVQIKHWGANDINFPVLERLVLRNCHLLKLIPHGIAHIATLEKIEVHGCAKSVEASARQILQEKRFFRRKREKEEMEANLESKFSGLTSDSNDGLFQVIKAVEATEATIKQQAEENNRLKSELQKKDEELENYKSGDLKSQIPHSDGRRVDHLVLGLESHLGGIGKMHINSGKDLSNTVFPQKDLMQSEMDRGIHNYIENDFDSSKVNGSLEVIPGGQATSDNSGLSQFVSPSTQSVAPSRYQLERDFDSQLNVSGRGLISMADVDNSISPKQDLVVKIREHADEIMQLKKHLAEYSVKEVQIRNEKSILEKRIAYMRTAFDQQQQDLVDAASKAISYRQDIIEENVRLTYALQAAQQDRSMFVSSLMPLLSEYSLQPPVADAQSIVSNIKVLFRHLQEQLLHTEGRLKESQYQIGPWRSDVNTSNFDVNTSNFAQSPSHAVGIKNGMELVPQPAYANGMISSSGPQTTTNGDLLGRQSGLGDAVARTLEPDNFGRYSPFASRNTDSKEVHGGHAVNQDDSSPVRNNEGTVSKKVTFGDLVRNNEVDDPVFKGHENDRQASANWTPKMSAYTTNADDLNSYSHLPPVLEEPSSSYSEAADDDPLPAIQDLQISGEAFPGRQLQASGYSIYGTTSCNFEWVRHSEDGSFNYIDGAKQPDYLVTADDINAYLAIEVQPLDDRKRKGELVKVFANEHKRIICDPEMQSAIQKTLSSGHASYKLSFLTGYPDTWEPATLVIKRDGYSIKCSGPSGVVVTQKFSSSTIVSIPYGCRTEFSIIDSQGTDRLLRADSSISRDTIVLTLRFFIVKAGEKKKGKKRGLFFNK